MASAFTDVTSPKGLGILAKHLGDRTYITGYAPSADDFEVYDRFNGTAPDQKFVHVARWYKHITSYVPERESIGGKASETKAAPAEAAAEDDFDLFGDTNEEEEAAREALIEQRAAEQRAKSALKNKPLAKSSIIWDIKPWEAETDLVAVEQKVRQIQMEGLTWGGSELKPIAFGVKKLTIISVIVDDLVSADVIQEQIEAFEDEPANAAVFTVDVKQGCTVGQVKEAVCEQQAIPVEQQRLTYSGKQLLNAKSLSYYKIQAGFVLELFVSEATSGLTLRAPTPAMRTVPTHDLIAQVFVKRSSSLKHRLNFYQNLSGTVIDEPKIQVTLETMEAIESTAYFNKDKDQLKLELLLGNVPMINWSEKRQDIRNKYVEIETKQKDIEKSLNGLNAKLQSFQKATNAIKEQINSKESEWKAFEQQQRALGHLNKFLEPICEAENQLSRSFVSKLKNVESMGLDDVSLFLSCCEMYDLVHPFRARKIAGPELELLGSINDFDGLGISTVKLKANFQFFFHLLRSKKLFNREELLRSPICRHLTLQKTATLLIEEEIPIDRMQIVANSLSVNQLLFFKPADLRKVYSLDLKASAIAAAKLKKLKSQFKQFCYGADNK